VASFVGAAGASGTAARTKEEMPDVMEPASFEATT